SPSVATAGRPEAHPSDGVHATSPAGRTRRRRGPVCAVRVSPDPRQPGRREVVASGDPSPTAGPAGSSSGAARRIEAMIDTVRITPITARLMYVGMWYQ